MAKFVNQSNCLTIAVNLENPIPLPQILIQGGSSPDSSTAQAFFQHSANYVRMIMIKSRCRKLFLLMDVRKHLRTRSGARDVPTLIQ